MKNIIEKKLRETLSPTLLELTDESHKHIGHSGWKKNQSTHFDLLIVSDRFKGMSNIQRHKCIYKILEQELQSGLHALSIKAFSPDEYR